MPKNLLGRDDNTFDGMLVSRGEFPSIEGATQSLTGYRLPLMDMSRGAGALANNAAVLGDALMKYRSSQASQAPQNELAFSRESDASQMDRIRQLRDAADSRRSKMAAQGKSFFPSME